MVTFNFSFTSDAADDIFSLSPIAGTVTGTLELADNTSGQQPTSLIITSAPAGLDIDLIGTDIITNAPGFLSLTGGIDVSGGVITSAGLFVDFDDADGDILQLFFDVDSGFAITDINGLANFGPTGGVGDDVGVTGNTNGFDAGDFTPVVPNTPPVADDDSFATDFETPLSIPAATGVLDGDTDADGDPLTAVLGTGPANGILTLNPDGSFDYTPNAGFSGTDSFTYNANDGTDDSNLATVTITVADAPTPVDPDPLTFTPINSFSGTAGADALTGTDQSDLLEGLGGDDVLTGLGDDDLLDGGPGNDTVVYQLDPAGATVDLFAGTATDGFGGTDTIIDVENVIGSEFGDVLTGDSGANTISGLGGVDIINGGGGNDSFIPGAGADNVTGGGGADNFFYLSPGEGGDTIDDFEVGVDTISIVGAFFPGGLSGGVVPASQFFDGPAATDASQRFGYNSATGEVFFDEDGLGGVDQITLATLTNQPAFTNADITVL